MLNSNIIKIKLVPTVKKCAPIDVNKHCTNKCLVNLVFECFTFNKEDNFEFQPIYVIIYLYYLCYLKKSVLNAIFFLCSKTKDN